MPKKAIICVDDEQIVLSSLRDQLLQHFGNNYLYEFAESADEALEVIEELNQEDIHVVLVVSDWLMPNMKGDELLIRVHERFPRTVKVLLTGQADSEAVDRVKRLANLNYCIHKPWDETTLVTVLKSGLEDTDD